MGRDKESLTEQQTKRTVTTILIRRIYKTNSEMHRATLTARCPVRSRAASAFPPRSSPTGTQHDGTWYGIPCSAWPVWVSLPGCVPSWLLVKINPALAEPRTHWYVELLKSYRVGELCVQKFECLMCNFLYIYCVEFFILSFIATVPPTQAMKDSGSKTALKFSVIIEYIFLFSINQFCLNVKCLWIEMTEQ